MENELKTLKDLEFGIHYIDSEEGWELNDKMVREKLKAEAVKWVREIRKDKTIGIEPNPNCKKKGDPVGTCVYGTEERKIMNQEKIDFIKHFFNLTEEDMK